MHRNVVISVATFQTLISSGCAADFFHERARATPSETLAAAWMGESEWLKRTTRYNAQVRHSCSFFGDNMETASRASALVSQKELAKCRSIY